LLSSGAENVLLVDERRVRCGRVGAHGLLHGK
jgi:hypothetical protein